MFSTLMDHVIVPPASTEPWLGVFAIWIVAAATKKHSVSVSSCFAARYSAVALGVYSARQQYQPLAAAVTPAVAGSDVAVPPPEFVVTSTAPPTCVPPLPQFGCEAAGADTGHLTVPDAGP